MKYVQVYSARLVREGTLPFDYGKVTGPPGVFSILRAHIPDCAQEHFVVLLLNSQHKVIGASTVSVGGLASSLLHPREVFRTAILASAAAIIVGHNHPSGDVTPSVEDRDVTRVLVEAGRIIGIPVIDHVIIGDGTNTYVSFVEAGLMTI